MTIGIGIIGAGVMGGDHAATLSTLTQGARLAAVSDADIARAQDVAALAPDVAIHREPRALIDDPRVEAVVIASPDATHVELTLACIAAGKPVLCEKPLSPTAEGCVAVMEAEMKAGRRLVQVGFMRRFDPGYRAMREAMLSGRLGAPFMLHCVHRNAAVPPWFDAGMVVTNSAVHEIDIARWLLDDELVEATLFIRGGRMDRQFMVLETAGGVIVDVELHLNAGYGYDVRAELVCESGTLSLSPQDPVRERSALAEMLHFAPDWRAHFRAAYTIQMQGFVDAVRSGTPCGASAFDGYAATAVAGACLDALTSGRKERVDLIAKPAFYRDPA
jgi:myo-inositol 2-dehydrogenase/D-chiro-inositol 1-dehydrogenase